MNFNFRGFRVDRDGPRLWTMMRSKVRFAAPVVVAGLIGLGAWIPAEASASTPSLPAISAAQLIAKAETAKISAYSATLQWSARLGLPSLSALTSGGGQSVATSTGLNPTSLLSGTHKLEVWVNGARRQRLALPASLAETDFIHNGDQAWIWDSSNQKVTHLTLAPAKAGPRVAMPQRSGAAGLTPGALAARALSAISPSTSVSVASPVYLAGRAAYVLRLSPRAGTAGATQSSVASVRIAVDASNGFPLQVSIRAKGHARPALQVGYTSLSFQTPPASEFTAPRGLSVVNKTVAPPSGHSAWGAGTFSGAGMFSGAGVGSVASLIGPPWGRVVESRGSVAGNLAGGGRSASQLRSLTTPVSGPFGSARLLHTALANVLFLPDGQVAAGLVTPAALEAAVARG